MAVRENKRTEFVNYVCVRLFDSVCLCLRLLKQLNVSRRAVGYLLLFFCLWPFTFGIFYFHEQAKFDRSSVQNPHATQKLQRRNAMSTKLFIILLKYTCIYMKCAQKNIVKININ